METNETEPIDDTGSLVSKCPEHEECARRRKDSMRIIAGRIGQYIYIYNNQHCWSVHDNMRRRLNAKILCISRWMSQIFPVERTSKRAYHTRRRKRAPWASYASIRVRAGLPPDPSRGRAHQGFFLTGIHSQVYGANWA